MRAMPTGSMLAANELLPPSIQYLIPTPCAYSNKEWAFRHSTADWSQYNWHVRSGGRYIMQEKAHRRYFACDVAGCRAVLYEDSPADPKTGEIIPGAELRMKLQKEHNHPQPETIKPCAELIARATHLLKSLTPPEVRNILIIEAGNGIGIPTVEMLHRCAEKRSWRPKVSRRAQPSPPATLQ